MRTRFGARLRAAVDDARVARGLGIPVGLVFAATFAVGSGLAGLGGALGAMAAARRVPLKKSLKRFLSSLKLSKATKSSRPPMWRLMRLARPI